MKIEPTRKVGQNIVILSAYQDYRSKKRASIQQVADGLVSAGHSVSFISTRFSHLSRRTGDSRLFLWDRANKVEVVNGVKCFLWRTSLHPFATSHPSVNALMSLAFALYARASHTVIDDLVRDADVIIVESSVAAISIRHFAKLNSKARIIYYASDRLDTVGAHPYVRQRLLADADLIDHVSLRSAGMVGDFTWAGDRLYKAAFGVNTHDYENVGLNPYSSGLNAVSVGSMLFDPEYFLDVAESFPAVQFHVIGCGSYFTSPPNVCIYDEMAFRDTLPYVKHATIGIAPYRPAPGADYLAESSLKLAQYEYFGLPSVCPDFAVGDSQWRCGYVPDQASSKIAATQNALDMVGSVTSRKFLTWEEVAKRVLDPTAYADTAL